MSALATVQKYQQSHVALDWDGMSSCLSPSYIFSDPAFPAGNLDVRTSKGMWQMFLDNKDTNKMQVSTKDAVETGEGVVSFFCCCGGAFGLELRMNGVWAVGV